MTKPYWSSWRIPLRLLAVAGDRITIASSLGLCPGSAAPCEGDPVSKRRTFIDKANEVWRIIALTLCLICPVLLMGLPGLDSGMDKETVDGVCELYTWCYRLYIREGYRSLVKHVKVLKDFALRESLQALNRCSIVIPGSMLGRAEIAGLTFPWARGHLRKHLSPVQYLGTDDTRSAAFFQLYLIGKSLPLPVVEKKLEVLNQHRVDYTRCLSHSAVARVAYDFALQYGRWLIVRKGSSLLSTFQLRLGTGASLSSSRRRGGKNKDGELAVTKFRRDHTLVLMADKTYYSLWGEPKIDRSLLSQCRAASGFPGFVEYPNRWLYLTREEAQRGVINDNFLIRDLALNELASKGVFRDLQPVPGLYGSCPFLGYYGTKAAYRENLCSLYKHRVPRTVEIHCILQRGDKARPINISEWARTVMGQPCRELLYDLMSADPEVPTLHKREGHGASSVIRRLQTWLCHKLDVSIDEPLRADHHEILESLRILSLDLSRCSDLITGDLSDSFLSGSFDALPDEAKHRFGLLWCLNSAPRTTVYRDGLETIQCEDDSGAPAMGDPMTWWMDNMYTKFVASLARVLRDRGYSVIPCSSPIEFNYFVESTFALDGKVPPNGLINWDFSPRGSLYCGDDNLTLDEPRLLELIVQIYPLLGGKIGDNACTISANYAVFCESLFKFNQYGQTVRDSVSYVDIVRLGGLCLDGGNPLPESRDIPDFWNRGIAAESAMEWFSKANPVRQVVAEYQKITLFQEIESAYSKGIQVHLPRCLGGLGFGTDLELGWSRANQATKGMIRSLARYDPRVFDAKIVSSLSQLSAQYTFEQITNPFAAEDNCELEGLLHVLFGRGAILTLDEISMQTGKLATEWPLSAYGGYQNRFSIPGLDGQWLPVSSGISHIKTILRRNHGIYDTKEKHNMPNLSKVSLMYYQTCSALSETLTTEEFEFSEMKGEEIIKVALHNLTLHLTSHFVNMSVCDEYLTDLVKPIVWKSV